MWFGTTNHNYGEIRPGAMIVKCDTKLGLIEKLTESAPTAHICGRLEDGVFEDPWKKVEDQLAWAAPMFEPFGADELDFIKRPDGMWHVKPVVTVWVPIWEPRVMSRMALLNERGRKA